jgi:hypothetical protein
MEYFAQKAPPPCGEGLGWGTLSSALLLKVKRFGEPPISQPLPHEGEEESLRVCFYTCDSPAPRERALKPPSPVRRIPRHHSFSVARGDIREAW